MSQNRYEKHLMRQRGAGPRNITANFGFSFDFPVAAIPQNDPTPVPPPAKRRRTVAEDVVAKQPSPIRPQPTTVQSEPAFPVAIPEAPKTSSKTPKRKAVKAQIVDDDDSFIAIKKPRKARAKKEKVDAPVEISASAVPTGKDFEKIIAAPNEPKPKARKTTKKQVVDDVLAIEVDQQDERAAAKPRKARQKTTVEDIAPADDVHHDPEAVQSVPAKPATATRRTKKRVVDLNSPPPTTNTTKLAKARRKAEARPDERLAEHELELDLDAPSPQPLPAQQPNPIRRPLEETHANIPRPSLSPKKSSKWPLDEEEFMPNPPTRKRQAATAKPKAKARTASKAAPKGRKTKAKAEVSAAGDGDVDGDAGGLHDLAGMDCAGNDLEDELSFGDQHAIGRGREKGVRSLDDDDDDTGGDVPPPSSAQGQVKSTKTKAKAPAPKASKKKNPTTAEPEPETTAQAHAPEPIPVPLSNPSSKTRPATKTAAVDEEDMDWLFATAPRERKRPAAKDLKTAAAAGAKVTSTTMTTTTTKKRKRGSMSDDLDLEDLVRDIVSIASPIKKTKQGRIRAKGREEWV